MAAVVSKDRIFKAQWVLLNKLRGLEEEHLAQEEFFSVVHRLLVLQVMIGLMMIILFWGTRVPEFWGVVYTIAAIVTMVVMDAKHKSQLFRLKRLAFAKIRAKCTHTPRSIVGMNYATVLETLDGVYPSIAARIELASTPSEVKTLEAMIE